MNQPKVYWNQQVIFFISIIMILFLVFPIQLLLGADYYTSNPYGYIEKKPWYHLINTKNLMLLHGALLISVTLWVLWSGWKKTLLNSIVGLLNSAILTIIIFLVVHMDWLYSCTDSCGFGTIVLMPSILLGSFTISLIFPSTR